MPQFGYQTLGFGSGTSDSGLPIPAWGGTRTMYAGGTDDSDLTNVVQSKTVASTSACTDYGDLTLARMELASLSNQTYMYTAGGVENDSDRTNRLDRKVFASDANATDYADVQSDPLYYMGSGVSDGSRGCWGGGQSGSGGEGTLIDGIRFMNLATEAYTRTFGDLSADRSRHVGHDGDTYGYWAGGYTGGPSETKVKTIDYITIASESNTSDFGDLSEEFTELAAVGSQVRIVFGGGSKANNYTHNSMEYMTVGTSGSTTTFGTLAGGQSFYQMAGSGDATKGEFMGGMGNWSGISRITYAFTIATTGNATGHYGLISALHSGDCSTGI